MSPRPMLGIGEYGHISTQTTGTTFVASCRYRDVDGKVRKVSAQGASKSKAEATLRKKLRGRASGTGDITSESPVTALAEVWYTGKEADPLLKYRTKERARSLLDNHIIPGLGSLTIRECTTARLEIFLQARTAAHGGETARLIRSVLSGMFATAARYDAVHTNPVTNTTVKQKPRTVPRALSLTEFVGMRTHATTRLQPLTTAERLERAAGDRARMGGANRSMLPLDLIDFLIATGCRAGEAVGMCWEDVHLSGPVPFVVIRQQVIREKGRGLVLAPTKERDVRRLAIPGFAVAMLERRATALLEQQRKEQTEEKLTGPVFPNQRGNLSDPSNVRKMWRDCFRDSPWEWVTQKTLRKTVATLVSVEQGSDVAAQQLGHASDGMTKRYYIEPSREPLDQRGALEQFGA